MHFRAEQFHAVHIECLSLCVKSSHVHIAFHSEESGRCRGCNAVLAGPGLRNKPCFSHSFREEGLTEDIVDFVGARVVQILPFEVHSGTA